MAMLALSRSHPRPIVRSTMRMPAPCSQGASVGAAVSLVDRSASADLLFVAASRSRRELDIIVPRSAFDDIQDLAQHITDRISLKTTTQTFDEVLERTGGRETVRVHNIEAQRDALPLRRLYEADVAEPLRGLQLARVQHAREEYQERKREIAEAGLSMEERLEAGCDGLRAMQTAVMAAYRELRPQPFGEWLRDREERRESAGTWAQPQEQSVEREQATERSFVQAEDLVQSDGPQRRR